MATLTRTYLVDDLDESEEDVENVLLALDGTNYEIDLSAANCRKAAGKAGPLHRRSLRRKGLEVCAGQARHQR